MIINNSNLLLDHHFHKYSSLYTLCFVVLFFSSARVLLRTFIPISGLAEFIGLTLSLIFVILIWRILDIKRYHVNKYGIILLLFGVFSIARYLAAGTSFISTIPSILTWIAILGLMASKNNELFIRIILKSFTIAMCMHLFSIVVPIDFIQNGLDAQTSYGVSRYGFNILSARNTGFNAAPGVLSFLSVQGLVIGIVMYYHEKRIIWLILLSTSLFCGILTFNRSFLILLAVIVLLLPMLLNNIRRMMLYYIIVATVITVTFLAIINYSNYSGIITKRFEADIIEKAIDTRMYGEAGIMRVFKAISNNPLIGSFVYDKYYDRHFILVGKKEGYVLVHNGLANIFATRGVVFGLFFVFLSALAFIRLYKMTKSDKSPPTIINIYRAFYAAFIVGQIFCLSESMLEMFIILMPLGLGLGLSHNDNQIKTFPSK